MGTRVWESGSWSCSCRGTSEVLCSINNITINGVVQKVPRIWRCGPIRRYVRGRTDMWWGCFVSMWWNDGVREELGQWDAPASNNVLRQKGKRSLEIYAMCDNRIRTIWIFRIRSFLSTQFGEFQHTLGQVQSYESYSAHIILKINFFRLWRHGNFSVY